MEYTMLEDIKAKFGKEGVVKCCLRKGGEQQLCELIERFVLLPIPHDPDTPASLEILELGTWNGVSAIVLSRYGNVTTIDPVGGPLYDEIQEAFPPTGEITRLVGGTPDEIRSGVRDMLKLDTGVVFSLALVDSSKDYAGLALDFEAVKPIGRVIFDDYWKNPMYPKPTQRFREVCRFIDDIPEGRFTKMGRFVLWESPEVL